VHIAVAAKPAQAAPQALRPPAAVTVEASRPAASVTASPPAVVRIPQVRTPQEARLALKAAAQKSGMPSFEGTNGKLYVNASGSQHLSAMEEVSPKGSGVLQIVKVSGMQHTLVIFEDQLVHLQYRMGTANWRLRSWGDRLRPSDKPTYSALIQLTPQEAENLRTRLAAVRAEEGPEETAGPQWERGHIKLSLGVNAFNCASGWCGVPIGAHGESLSQIVGVPVNGDPNSLERMLEAAKSERVFGIAVYGPKIPDFGLHPEQPQVKN
jgi:hypothetical protein